jgi:hypothetical protein
MYFIVLGNANLIYTVIRKRQVFFALSNLATDTSTIAKLSTKTNNTTLASSKKNTDNSTNKQNIFQTTSKLTIDGEPLLNRDISQQSNINSSGMITNSVTTTLAETPCKYKTDNLTKGWELTYNTKKVVARASQKRFHLFRALLAKRNRDAV